MKNLENYGVQEMNAKEMKRTSGGGWMAYALGVITGALDNSVYFMEQSGFYHQGGAR